MFQPKMEKLFYLDGFEITHGKRAIFDEPTEQCEHNEVVPVVRCCLISTCCSSSIILLSFLDIFWFDIHAEFSQQTLPELNPLSRFCVQRFEIRYNALHSCVFLWVSLFDITQNCLEILGVCNFII